MSPMIVVADDDPLLRTLLDLRLSEAGYRTTTAPDGLAAMEALEATGAAVIVLDAMMPRMGGYEVLRRLRAANETPVRIIMLTALRHEDDAINALRQGADDFMTKPFSPDELIARIARFAPCEG